ncbi:MAG: rhomboid family intramembrane serine protease [Bdellovibrionales bacterium]
MILKARLPVVVNSIIIINIPIFLLWMFSPQIMEDHFAVSWTGLQQGRFWTLLTSVFSHFLFIHLFVNMFVLRSFGSLLERLMGHLLFLKFYLIAGLISSFTHCFVSNYFVGKPDLPAVGASGAIAGLILLFAMLFPKEKILLFGIIPIPAFWGAMGFIGLDLWGLIEQTQGGGLPIGHGAHLGGAFTGIIYYFFFRRRARQYRGI